MKLSVYLGDATHGAVLLDAGIRKSAAVVVTVPDPYTCCDIIRNIRLTARGSEIIARGRYHIAIKQLEEASASSVINEGNLVVAGMARNVLDFPFIAIPYSMAYGLAANDPIFRRVASLRALIMPCRQKLGSPKNVNL